MSLKLTRGCDLSNWNKKPLACAIVLLIAAASLNGCSNVIKPMDTEEGTIPAHVFDYRTSDTEKFNIDEKESSEKRAVYDMGVRMGATSGYKKEVERLYAEINQFGDYFERTFSFTNLVLPEGLLPPVIVLTEQVVTYHKNERLMSARVFKTVQDAILIESNPSWRYYLNLQAPDPEKPSERLKKLIEEHASIWRNGVKDGWIEGVKTGRIAMDVAIHELQRDFMGMQLFRMLWLGGMVEPPKIITKTDHVQGGGSNNKEMQVGVKHTIITQPAYLVPDTEQWRALSMEAWEEMPKLGLSDIIDLDNPMIKPGL